MKIRITLIAAASVCGLIFTVQSGFAQGSLTPSGPPGPTMITLSQIEPRTIVNAANTPGDAGDTFIISKPGSYYLTGNIAGVSNQNGITITANNVVLDLSGFALQGVSGGDNGIYIPNAQTNITVRNGTVNGWGGDGVYAGDTFSLVVERLNVSSNEYGIYLNEAAGVVRDCNSQNNDYDGVDCYGGGIVSGCNLNNNGQNGLAGNAISVSGCMADYNGSCGINVNSCNISGCTASGNSGPGIEGDYSNISSCTANGNSDGGIYVLSGTASGCEVEGNSQNGIYVGGGTVSGCCVVSSQYSGIYVSGFGCSVIGNNCIGNNRGLSSSEAGIYIYSGMDRIEDNQVTSSGYAGIVIYNNSSFSNNIIIKNSVSGTSSGTGNNYVTPGNQTVGPLITSFGTISSSNPWANFSY